MARNYHRILLIDDRAHLSPRLVYLGASLSCMRGKWGHTPSCEIPYGKIGTFEQSGELGKHHPERSLIKELLYYDRRVHDSLAQWSVMIFYDPCVLLGPVDETMIRSSWSILLLVHIA